jgi:hypothetical protein
VPSRGTKFIELKKWNKGLVLVRTPEDGEAAEAENVEVNDDVIRRRNGYSKVHTTTNPGGVNGRVTALYTSYLQSPPVLLALVDNTLMSSTGGDFSILTNTFAPSAPAYATFKAFGGNLYIGSKYGTGDTAQQLKKWTGSGAPTALTGTPNGSLVTSFAEKLWVAGDDANPSRVYWSRSYPDQEYRDTAHTTPGFPTANFLDVTVGDGDKVTGFAKLLNALIVFKERSIHRITGTPPEDAAAETGDHAVFSNEDQAGCIAPRSIAASSSFVLYLSRTGIYSYDGTRPQELSVAIRPLFDTLNENELKNAVGGWFAPDHYVLSVPLEDSAWPNLIISVHLRPNLSFTLWTSLQVSALETFPFSGVTVPVIGLNGKVGRMDADTDDGDEVQWKYRTGPLNMGDLPFTKTIRRGWAWLQPKRGNITIEYLRDWATTAEPIFVDLAGYFAAEEEQVRLPIPAGGTARTFSVRVSGDSNGSAPVVQEMAFEYFTRTAR